ncbi:MAG: nucleotidyltransferase family protein [Pseudomonadota bacterium]
MHSAIGFPLTMTPGSAQQSYQKRLGEVLRADTVIWRALCEARSFDLPDWWIVSGAIYNTVWNHLSDLPPGTGIRDVDLFYFDPDTRWEAEDRFIQKGKSHFSDQPPVEIRNQARVHLWYKDHFGHPMPPFSDCRDGVRNFASQTHAVGVTLGEDDQIEVYAPYGLDAMFQMRMVPNRLHLNRDTHESKFARAKTIWRNLTIEPWPETSVVRAHAWQDWDDLRAMIQRAFAYMEGRIDPPSSLHRLDADALAQKAQEETCFLAHDGRQITGCVFCKREGDQFYVGKLAVDPVHQGKGIGKALMARIETEASRLGCSALSLDTRIELTENHEAFAKLGFTKTGQSSHPGFDRPTSIRMQRLL